MTEKDEDYAYEMARQKRIDEEPEEDDDNDDFGVPV